MVPRLTPIKTITFDVDGTLWDFEAVMRRSLGHVLIELEGADPKAAALLTVDRMIEIRDTVHDELKGEVWDLEEVRRDAFRRTLEDVGRPDEALAARLAEVYFQHRYAGSALFADVRPTLEALSPLYSLGIVSNGNSYPEHLGLENLMPFQVYAQDHGGIEKPDPRIFRIAVEMAVCAPHELAHVGDSLETDVAGARSAGVRSVWLNRNGRERDAVAEPDWEIRSLRELSVQLIGQRS